VSLPAGQQQLLDGIETDLEGCEPLLRSMFAIFTRLTRDDGAPRTESLRPESRRPRWTCLDRRLTITVRTVIAIPIALGLVALFVFAAINSSAVPGCGPAAAPHTAAIHTWGCQSVLESHGRS
jgi:hypothetical protein